MRARDQPVEIAERAEYGIDRAVIRHVVAEILHRRDEERRDPDRVDAQFGNVIELARDPVQIADAIIIAVEETARIDLIDHRAAPPLGLADQWAAAP